MADRRASVAHPLETKGGLPHAWRPTPLIRASIVLHAAAPVVALAAPSTLPWVVGGMVGNHALLGAAGLWPKSRWLGPNIIRLPPAAAARHEVALTFDDGPDPAATPAVLDILEGYGARATFFCIGRRAAAHPEMVREIARRGHDVENHSYAHPGAFATYGLARLSREIVRAQEILTGAGERAPRYFRAPLGLRNPLLEPVLARTGLRLVSWTRRGYDSKERDPMRVLDRLTRRLEPGDILLLHDGNSARMANGQPVVAGVLPLLLDHLMRRRLAPVSLSRAIGVPA